MTELNSIRNFSIVAHIDHGKSTLADRLIQFCGGLTDREMKEQVLDTMELERKRGITIKAQTVRLTYNAKDGNTYILNLMDTPGHVDFSYEVSRSLAACESTLIVVDSTQGVEAQTLANAYQAINNDHEILPVLNKIDLPSSEPEKIKEQIEDVLGVDTKEAVDYNKVKGTISLHRKKHSNTLYTINALNEVVANLNNGVIDSKFVVPWENFKNTLMVTNSEGLNKISTRIYKIIKID